MQDILMSIDELQEALREALPDMFNIDRGVNWLLAELPINGFPETCKGMTNVEVRYNDDALQYALVMNREVLMYERNITLEKLFEYIEAYTEWYYTNNREGEAPHINDYSEWFDAVEPSS
mgnify:FL=1